MFYNNYNPYVFQRGFLCLGAGRQRASPCIGTPACIIIVSWDASVYHHRVLGRQRVSSSCVVIASKQKDIVADLDKEIVEETLIRFVKYKNWASSENYFRCL